MVNVDDVKILEAFRLYCNLTERNQDSWNSIFDFTSVVGFSVISGGLGDPHSSSTNVSERTAKAIDWMTGPHAITLAKVLKNQRYSFYGRLRAPIIKAGHALAFAGLTIHSVLKQVIS